MRSRALSFVVVLALGCGRLGFGSESIVASEAGVEDGARPSDASNTIGDGMAGWEPCNGIDDDLDGLVDEDTDLATDPRNCGACGNECTYANGIGVCTSGVCELRRCEDWWGDCDADAENGCERNIKTSNAHCGRCGRACTTGTCSEGHCPADVVALAGGGDFTCARAYDGAPYCWGGNSVGQLGDGTTTDRRTPTVVGGLPSVELLAAGDAHACAIETGVVFCWGANASGQLGDGTTVNATAPVRVALSANASGVAAGGRHTCALVATGAVRCWGSNANGQLGDGTVVDSSTPIAVTGLTDAVEITAGDSHSCARRPMGISCWGANANGQLGDGTTTDSSVPTLVVGLDGGVQIDAGAFHTCLHGSMWCWGSNSAGQLGDGTLVDRPSPVSAGIDHIQVAAGGRHTCVSQPTGRVQCMGANGDGQLGDGTTTDRAVPAEVPTVTRTRYLTAGMNHSCAVNDIGVVRCWGENASGQLGNGSTVDRSSPVLVRFP